MNHGLFIAFAVLIVIGVIIGGIFAWRAEKKRKEALRAIAARNGWTFIEKDRHDRPDRYGGYEPFGQGHTRYAFNIFAGRVDEAPFEVFDYHYAVTRQSGKTTTTDHYYFQVAALEMPIAAPGLVIRKEHIGHKIFDALGGEDIDFESDEFSRRFWVRCVDRRFAYDVVHPRTMEFLMQDERWVWQWRGRTLLVHRSGRLKPTDVEPLLAMARRFRECVPRHLLAAVG